MNPPLRVALLLVFFARVATARAQSTDSSAAQQAKAASTAADSAYLRARKLVVGGNGVAGRAVVDSMIAVSPPGFPPYAEALYWRASLAATAADAERDYRRIIVDYPFSPRTAAALLALAQLESARGDRANAEEHLQRYLLEYPSNSDHTRAGLNLGRLLLTDGKTAKGCAVLTRTLAGVPAEAVELRNQIAYYAQRCVGVDTVEAGPVTPAPPAPPMPPMPPAKSADSSSGRVRPTTPPRPPRLPPPAAKTDSVRLTRDTIARNSVTPKHVSIYSVQVAAYTTKRQAEQLMSKLSKRGFTARVWGSAPPFRVRIGRYSSEAAALRARRALGAKGIAGFVTPAEPESQ